eukprot:CAMPEP_0175081706 /NCGR_PEP_ID=MMETSP0052_2-20121109/26312_1 /TAXON_ID=51329 ORGANISM="Polytomella parva, Strain SAG 63-3" /NCGR_SAMPLE_ID=MMETSP0052_2 /ASSEMBLY_ACC=CAM_ASM_000194 /LENGTH=99 /DNA_ID=CAMNT_0016352747 /DNA_START=87 /DNA_END=386 /DNA_ORIENTATION=-
MTKAESYPSPEAYYQAKLDKNEPLKPKNHRCSDRFEDMSEVLFGEDGSIVDDLGLVYRNWRECMNSPEGQEPAMPYVVLPSDNRAYIDPKTRATYKGPR